VPPLSLTSSFSHEQKKNTPSPPPAAPRVKGESKGKGRGKGENGLRRTRGPRRRAHHHLPYH